MEEDYTWLITLLNIAHDNQGDFEQNASFDDKLEVAPLRATLSYF